MSASAQAQGSDPTTRNRKLVTMTATALPTIQECGHHLHHPNTLSAYRLCLGLEEAAQNAEDGQKVIYARILGYLILFIPSDRALAEVVKVIHSCDREGDQYDNLFRLGESFLHNFIQHFRKFKGRTPATTSHPSRGSFDKTRESLVAKLKQAPRDHKEAKKLALIRDGYRCVVTGKYDDAVFESEDLSVEQVLAAGGTVLTQCAHILPESTFFNVEGPKNEAKAKYAGSVLAVLQRFGYSVENLNGALVHSLPNIMTMEKDIHDRFDRLQIWLEATNTENQYRPKTCIATVVLPEVVTFTSSNPECLPLPSPQLLALHATCSKVARMSGAAEYLDKFDRDMDDLDVLAPDGTSSAILNHAIWEKMGTSINVGA